MSGRKTVTIDSYELDRLRQQAARATTLTQANAALERINRTLTGSVNQANSRINTLTNNINNLNSNLSAVKAGATKEVNALRTELQNTVRDSNRRLAQLNTEHQQQLNALESNFQAALNATRSEMADAMNANNRRIEEAMNENNRIISNQIDQTNSRIDAVSDHMNDIASAVAGAAGDLNALHDMAEEFAEMARLLIADSRNYRCELLLPGQLKPVETQLNTARTQIDLPLVNAPAAQLAARQAYLDALDFHERIIQAEQEWILRHQAAYQAVSQAQARIEASRQVTHEATKMPIDVDQWSDGDLSELADNAAALLRHLEQDANNDSITDLNQIQASGRWLEAETVETAAFALGAAEASQFRVNIAQAIANTLRATNGLRIVGHGYQGDDLRSAHRVHLRNPMTGLSLVVTQTPRKDDAGNLCNTLEVEITDPGTCNLETAHNVAGDICHALRNAGFRIGELTTVPGCEDITSGRPENANLQQWRAETATTVKPQHRPKPACSATAQSN